MTGHHLVGLQSYEGPIVQCHVLMTHENAPGCHPEIISIRKAKLIIIISRSIHLATRYSIRAVMRVHVQMLLQLR